MSPHLVSILLILVLSSANKSDEGTIICWSATRPLSWEDFKGQPERNSRGEVAVTLSGIRFNYEAKGNQIQIRVVSYFDKNNSWGKMELVNPEILVHEQKHFDITEWYARKLRSILKSKPSDEKKPDKYAQKYYHKMTAECFETQKQYDRETNYSRNTIRQLEWNKRIADTLKSFEAEADTVINWIPEPMFFKK